MGLLEQETFICLDCETTGLNIEEDRIIEFAAVKFTLDQTIDKYETLINPMCDIPEVSQKIHHISQAMIQGKPSIDTLLDFILSFVGDHIIVGHSIGFDIEILMSEAKRFNKNTRLPFNRIIDTLRLARNYGRCPSNSLETLRQHFNIKPEGAHRAMSDVTVNIEVFKHLIRGYRNTEELFSILSKPIAMNVMPLGKHKGRDFKEIPTEYLQWAAHKNFDEDLLFSIRKELQKRKQGRSFLQESNPFLNL